MPPVVEDLRNLEASHISYFVVDLNDPVSFDPEHFDQMCEAVTKIGKSRGIIAKFIVQDHKMNVFASGIDHIIFYEHLGSGDLQCAGSLAVTPEGFGNKAKRIVLGSSETLAGILPKSKSEEYKHTVLAEKLGKYFLVK